MSNQNPLLALRSSRYVIGSFVVACSTLATPTLVQADWTGGIEGGTVTNDGDTNTRLRLKATNSDRPFSQQVYADWIQGEGSEYEIGYIPRYWFSDKTYAFGEASARTAEVQLIDREFSVLVGLGVQLLSSDTQSLFAEAGVGQVATTFTTRDITGEKATSDAQIAEARLGAYQILSDTIKLELDGVYATSEDITQRSAEAGISLAIPGGAIKYSYRIRSTTVGDGDAVDSDDSSLSFTYGF